MRSVLFVRRWSAFWSARAPRKGEKCRESLSNSENWKCKLGKGFWPFGHSHNGSRNRPIIPDKDEVHGFKSRWAHGNGMDSVPWHF